MDIAITLNTNITSKITAVTDRGAQFSEALLLMDDPNAALYPPSPVGGMPGQLAPQRPVLNCGHLGAADSSPAGAGICGITGTGK